MATKRIANALVLFLVLAIVLALRHTKMAGAREMLHGCTAEAGLDAVRSGEAVSDDHFYHDIVCGDHTATPIPTNTRIPTNTPRPRSTNTPTSTNTPRPRSTNTPTSTNTPRPGPTNTPKPVSAQHPPTPCVVTHAATPAQLCVSGNGFQYYFVGPGGVQEGPYLPSVSDLAELHSVAMSAVELYRGLNPMTGKPVQIDYLPNEQVIRVFTYYADTPYSMDKPYIFTLNNSHQVTYQAW